MIARSLRWSICLVAASGLSACCFCERTDTFHPEFFGTGAERCSGRSLVRQGFSGLTDEGTVIEYVGSMEGDLDHYNIYYYDHENYGLYYEDKRIIVLNVICDYFGSYFTEIRPSRVSGNEIFFDVPEDLGNVIRFEQGKVPRKVRFNGRTEVLTQ